MKLPMNIHSLALRLCCALAVAAMPFVCTAQGLLITPLRVDLSAAARSAIVTVTNRSDTPRKFTVYVERWSQNGDGADVMEDTSDLIYFPRSLALAPDAEAVIRVGVRQAQGAAEKSYRLFIEDAEQVAVPNAQTGAMVRLRMRLSLPVLVKPSVVRQQLDWEGEPLAAGGKLSFRLQNPGTVAQALEAISAARNASPAPDALALPLANRYLLSGSSRLLEADLPVQWCKEPGELTISARSATNNIQRKLQLAPEMCR